MPEASRDSSLGTFGKEMKTTLLALLSLLFLASAYAGGPSIDSNSLKVGKIITTPDEIIMEINGSFNLFTSKTPEEGTENGNAKNVGLVIRDGILRIPRKQWKHPGGDEFEVYLDWDKYRKEIMKCEGKEISTQMWSSEVIIRNGFPREIVSEVCKIWEKKK